MWYNPVMEWLLKSPLHRMIDGSTMIVYYTGRKTGKAYHIPAGYLQADDTLITISFKQRSWWRNLRGGANVTILLRGMLVSAHAVVHEDEQGVVEGLKEFIGAKPQAARMVGVDLDLDGQPIPDSLQQAALKKKKSHHPHFFPMNNSPRFPLVFWRIISRLNQRLISGYKPKGRASERVLILTTVGRKSGMQRSTPLQYEEVEGSLYIASARGKKADWYRNLMANPQVEVQVKDQHFHTCAELITEPEQISDFLELRLKRHPHFMGVMLRLEGLPTKYTRADLERLAGRLAIVRLQPVGEHTR